MSQSKIEFCGLEVGAFRSEIAILADQRIGGGFRKVIKGGWSVIGQVAVLDGGDAEPDAEDAPLVLVERPPATYSGPCATLPRNVSESPGTMAGWRLSSCCQPERRCRSCCSACLPASVCTW